MRIDYQSAISALKRALELLKASVPSSGEFAARLFDLTTILFENELCATTLQSILAERTSYDDAIERCERLALASIRPQLRAFFGPFATIPDALKVQPHAMAQADALRDLDVFMAQHFRWDLLQPARTGLVRTHAEVFALFNDDEMRNVNIGTLLQLHKIREAGGRARALVESLAVRLGVRDAATFDGWQQAELGLENAIGLVVQTLRFAEQVLRGASLQPMVDRLWSVHTEIRELLGATGSFPLLPDGALMTIAGSSNFEALIASAERIVSLVEFRLQLGAVEHHALVRLRSYLEHFGRGQLLADFDREEQEHPNARQFERRLQQHVDRFLFSEGLFPITHAEAGGGPIDTFLQGSEYLFSEVRSTHQMPVLLELKAQVRSNTTAADVRAKANAAIEQAAIYSSHLRARPEWSAHNVTAIVAYDGPQRYTTEHPGLMLVYLGDALPSRGSAVLALE